MMIGQSKPPRKSHFFTLVVLILVTFLISCGGENSGIKKSAPVSTQKEITEPVEKSNTSDDMHDELDAILKEKAKYKAMIEDKEKAKNKVRIVHNQGGGSFPLLSKSAGRHNESVELPSRMPASDNIIQPSNLDYYKVKIGAEEHMELSSLPYELNVWIGDKSFAPDFPENMVQDEKDIAAEGEFAIVKPYAPTFIITPEKSTCFKISRQGSDLIFALTPTKTGSFNIKAKVDLYDTPDCSNSAVPKISNTLNINVTVDKREVFLGKVKELGEVFWQKLLEFWGAFLALVFALILFLIRRRLTHWFGFENNDPS